MNNMPSPIDQFLALNYIFFPFFIMFIPMIFGLEAIGGWVASLITNIVPENK